jgi:hypothetical protein
LFNKIAFLIFGAFLSWLGFEVIRRGGFVLYGYYVSFANSKAIFGSALIAFGVLFIWFALTKRAQDFKGNFFVCPKCGDYFNQKDVSNLHCPNCAVKLEDLEGFYDRHPELKEKEENDI